MRDKEDLEQWSKRFAEASPTQRAALLGGAAVKLSVGLLERGIDGAARTYVEAERAFKRELDPNMEEAKILEERKAEE